MYSLSRTIADINVILLIIIDCIVGPSAMLSVGKFSGWISKPFSEADFCQEFFLNNDL